MPKTIKMKIAIIGPPNSGKTSFINNFIGKQFNQEYLPT